MTRLILVSTEGELKPIVENYSVDPETGTVNLPLGDDENILAITGIGSAATLINLCKLVRAIDPEEILQLGFCGSFDPGVPLGSIFEVNKDCFADLGFDDKGQFLPLNKTVSGLTSAAGWLEYGARTNLPCKTGVTVNTTSGSIERIKMIVNEWKPDVESMEGAAAMSFCLENSIPFIQVRSVSNYVEPRDKTKWKMSLAAEKLSNWLIEYLKSVS